MDEPSQWYGTEPNTFRKDWDATSVRVCLMALWGYAQAAGNMAIPIVYHQINRHRDDFLADRVYLPATPRDLNGFISDGYPIFGIESQHELGDFDVIGTSISYPVLSINLVKMLRMSGIPPRRTDRVPEQHPMVMVGGQMYGAPEVVANIVDCVFAGEAEDEPGQPGIGAVLDRVKVFKTVGLWSTDRAECYRRLAQEFNFLYFPALVDVFYGYEDRESVADQAKAMGQDEVYPSKQVIGYAINTPGIKGPFRKRHVKDLDAIAPMTAPPLLFTDPGAGAGDIETSRGCPAWCTFCALTMRQKPYRQRSPEYMAKYAADVVKNTGVVHLAPFGPDFPMHTKKKALLKAIMENVTDDIDASSMRVDDFLADSQYILLQAHAGMDTVTLGVEGNSQRMRDFIGKGAGDDDIKKAFVKGVQAGITKFKFYMIAAMPGEDENDIARILQLGKDIADLRDALGSRARIQFSWAPMLIEGNTPLQWFAPTTINLALSEAWDQFRELGIDFRLGGKAKKDRLGYFQLTQRASREIGAAMVDAVIEMDTACWGGAPKGLYEKVEERLHARGFLNGYADAYDERVKHDMFGWEMIDQGINVELFWVTYAQMVEFLESTDSATYDEHFYADYHGSEWIARCDERCMGRTCGVCDKDDLKIRHGYIAGAADEVDIDLTKIKVIDQTSVVQRVRARLTKHSTLRFVMNDHHRYAFRRACNIAELPLTKRSIKFASDLYKFKDWTYGRDYVDFALTSKVFEYQMEEYVSAMNDVLLRDSAMFISAWDFLPETSPDLAKTMDLSLFTLEVSESPAAVQKALDAWVVADYVTLVIKEIGHLGLIREEVNAKDLVEDIWMVRDGHKVALRMLLRGKATPYLVYAALFDKVSWVGAADKEAVRDEVYQKVNDVAYDFFSASCVDCGRQVPVPMVEVGSAPERCPKCDDIAAGRVIAAMKESVT
jgi:radical SAM superfamily enzyme YgiQ (UPF0313 family)